MLAHLLSFVLFGWLAAVVAVVPTSDEDNQPLPEAPPYRILPPTWPYPAFPTCSTPYGICRFPQNVAAGTPCACLAANGVWVSGHITVSPLYPLPPSQPAPPPPPRRPPGRQDE
jgi:hypothetical protein